MSESIVSELQAVVENLKYRVCDAGRLQNMSQSKVEEYGIPNLSRIHFPLLLSVADAGGSTELLGDDGIHIVSDTLAKFFQLSKYQREATYDDGDNIWRKQVRSSRKALVKFGLLHHADVQHGVWAITDNAIVLLEEWTSNGQISGPLTQAISGLDDQLKSFIEGNRSLLATNSPERNRNLRNAVFELHENECAVCKLEFLSCLPSSYIDLLQVHHLRPLSTLLSERYIDPRIDVVLVCPTCHSIIHHGGKCRTVQEVKSLRVCGMEMNKLAN